MHIRIEPFQVHHLQAVGAFSAEAWPDRPTSDAYLRWRYLDPPEFEGLVAMRGDECVAGLWAFRRTYMWDEQDVTVLEGHDWWALPTARGSGVGVKLLQALMDRPEPQVAWGGSRHSQTIMPALKWATLGSTHELILPLGGQRVAAKVVRSRLLSKALGEVVRQVSRQLLRYAPTSTPRGGEVLPLRNLDEGALSMLRQSGTFGPVTPRSFLAWLEAAPPSQGVLLPLGFQVGGELRGWSLARVVRTGAGVEGVVLDAYADDPGLYPWIAKATVMTMLPWGPDRVAARTSLGPLRDALLGVGFRERSRPQINVWLNDLPVPRNPPRPSRLCTDLALGPYGR